MEKFATSSASVVDICGKFATGVNDTGGKFVTGVNDAGGTAPLSSRVLTMDHITIETPNSEGSLFFTIYMQLDLIFGGESKIKQILRSKGRQNLNISWIYFFEY